MHAHTTPAWMLASALALGCAAQLAACGGGGVAEVRATESQPASSHSSTVSAPLWSPNGRAMTSPTSPSARSSAQWSGQRYATREQLAHEELVAGPYTLVIDADDEAAVESGLQLADIVHTHAGGKATFGVFVRSRHPALAARLAERLTLEQGWANVFVVQ
jgi:hypothetical protein